MRTLLALVLLTLLASVPVCRAAQSFEEAFQSALLAEEARRDLAAAIRGYEDVVARVDAQRAIAATAVFRLGECYRKVGRTNDAVVQYQRLLRDFPAEETLARMSRENLAALGVAPPGSPTTASGPTERPSTVPAANVEQQEIERLRTLFDRSPDLLDASTEGMTPLGLAASRGQLVVVKELIAWGADVNKRMGRSLETALHAAAGAGHKAVVEVLLDAKADPNAPSKDGKTPLSTAVSQGFVAVVETLLERGATPRNETAHASLFAAIESGRTNLIEPLIQAGADVNGARPSPDGRGSTPLAEAILADRRDAARILMRHGAVTAGTDGNGRHFLSRMVDRSSPTPDAAWLQEVLQAVPREGYPQGLMSEVLVTAVERDRNEFIPLLIQAGASPDTRPNGRPLLCSAAVKSPRTLERLLEARPDLNATTANGWTALHLAVEADLTNNLKLLLEAGADPNRLNHSDQTPLSLVLRAKARVLSPPGAPEAMGTQLIPRSPRRADRGSLETSEALLRAAGAREDLALRVHTYLQRGPYSRPQFRRAENSPAPRLADALSALYSNPSLRKEFSWPDLSALRIHRWTEDGKRQVVVPVAADWRQRPDCDWNVALEWGDTVEIPELDHVQGVQWPGLAEPTLTGLRRCSARQVSLAIKDETFELILRPAALPRPPGQFGLNAINTVSVFEINSAPSGGGVPFLPLAPRTSTVESTPIELDTCTLRNVLTGSNRLRASSDLSRVQVTRASTDQTWTFDVDRDPWGAEFWLIEGDAIVVPEKGSTP